MAQFSDIDKLAVSTLRLLSVDQVESAQSGHPGAPLGLAPVAHVIFKQLRCNPDDEHWINRDRFVLSNGHSCALLYSMLHLLGYDYTIEDLRQFRQVNSRTPGHPEFHSAGVEITSGPLGQGISNAVGMAIAQANFAATYNEEGFPISDSYTFAIVGDGCLQEGVTSETSSLAGHLQLGNLITFYDSNSISIDGKTSYSFDEDVLKRYEAYGWEVMEVDKGDDDMESISSALEKAKLSKDKPTIIKVTTTIGFGSLQQGTAGVHGSALKADDVKQLKKRWGFDPNKSFVVPQEVYDYYKKTIVEPGQQLNAEWNRMYEEYKIKFPEKGKELQRRLKGELPEGWEKHLPMFNPDDDAVATRKTSQQVLTNMVQVLPELIGGSADLTPSNLTRWEGAVDFQPPITQLGNYAGRYIRYGVREHGMGAIMNGISAFGANYKPYGGTFLNFVSYAAGAVRLAALSGNPVIWVATHDSIGLGEDGPTHQPIETLAHLRAIPNMHVWRPADGNETSAAYYSAIKSGRTPSVVALSRQNLPQLEHSSFEKALKGGYVIHDIEDPDIILASTGSEVSISIDAAKKLYETKKIKARVVSMPDFYSFDKQTEEYRFSVLPDGVPIMSFEVLATSSWGRYAHQSFGLNEFGRSGKGSDIYKLFDFTADGVAARAEKTINYYKGKQLLSPIGEAF